jgi:hypothetical protein
MIREAARDRAYRNNETQRVYPERPKIRRRSGHQRVKGRIILKWTLKQTEYETVEVNVLINFWVPQGGENILTHYVIIGFPRRIMLHAVSKAFRKLNFTTRARSVWCVIYP